MKGIIAVATHRSYRPFNTDLYQTVLIGKNKEALKNQFSTYGSDDEIDGNLADKNDKYGELTALWVLWKKYLKQYDYVGLCHYRRFLSKSVVSNKNDRILNKKDMELGLLDKDILLPIPNALPITVKESRGVDKKDWENLYFVIQERCPEYKESLEKVLSARTASYYNLFVMRKVLADEYCEWLFDVLLSLEGITDYTYKNEYQRRILACHAEFLLDVFVEYHHLSARYYPIAYTEASIKGNALMNIKHLVRGDKEMLYRAVKHPFNCMGY